MNTIDIEFKKDEKTIELWLKTRLAKELKQPVEDVDITAPFNSLGLDSIVLVTLANDLSDWIGEEIDPWGSHLWADKCPKRGEDDRREHTDQHLFEARIWAFNKTLITEDTYSPDRERFETAWRRRIKP